MCGRLHPRRLDVHSGVRVSARKVAPAVCLIGFLVFVFVWAATAGSQVARDYTPVPRGPHVPTSVETRTVTEYAPGPTEYLDTGSAVSEAPRTQSEAGAGESAQSEPVQTIQTTEPPAPTPPSAPTTTSAP